MNIDTNRVIFDFVDLSYSSLSKGLKFVISHLSSLSDLIEFEEDFKNTLILSGFDSHSPQYSLNRDYNLKWVSLEIILK